MIKNVQWDMKTKIKTFLVLFFTVFAKIAFWGIGKEWDSGKDIVTQIAASLAFAAFVALTLNEKGNKLFSAQGILMTAATFMTLGVIVSHQNLSSDTIRMLVFMPLILICSQKAVLVPVSAVLSVVAAAEYSGTAVMFLSAASGVSLIYLSEELKKSALWKKILVAVSQAVIIGAAVYTFWYRRYSFTVHSLVTELWDSVAIVFSIAVFVILAVVSIKKKRPVTETAGYIISAVFSVVPLFIYSSYAFPAGASMIMMLAVICQNGLLLEELSENALKSVCSKFKK
ncbi:MAG: hypothetical protein IKU08_03615 [Clostridia bacterium]|nr:hypothetical protein [Clostridia bacterium]